MPMSSSANSSTAAATTIDEQGFVEINLDTSSADITQPLPDTIGAPEPTTTASSVTTDTDQQSPANATDIIQAPKLITAAASKASDEQPDSHHEANTNSSKAQPGSPSSEGLSSKVKPTTMAFARKLKPLLSKAREGIKPIITRVIKLLKALGVGSAKHSSRAIKAFSGLGAGLLVLAFLVLFFRLLISLILLLMAGVQLGMAGMISKTDS